MGNGKTRAPEWDVKETSGAVYGQGCGSGAAKPQGFNALTTWAFRKRENDRERVRVRER